MTSGIAFLDWALVALSSFNTLVPVWLGCTILLNAEHRSRGVWLAGLGMLATGCFFLFHSVMLEGGLLWLPTRMRTWWYLGWLPVIVLPFGWYVAMLWFGGFWEHRESRLRRLHRYPLPLLLVAGAVITLAFAAAGRPSLESADRGGASGEAFIVFGSTLPFYLYCGYIIITLLFALDALRRAEPTGNLMSNIARMRARPWLLATSVLQILVSVIVSAAMLWLATPSGEPYDMRALFISLGWLDMVVSVLIAASIVLIGKAMISYEIFTGKILPRQGLRRHWRNALLLGAGFGASAGVVLTADVPAFWILLGTTLLSAMFYALLNWRSYLGRERYLAHLRPFVGSQGLYNRMLSAWGTEQPADGVALPFRALAADVLGARLAYLVPLGPLAPLAGTALAFPEGIVAVLPSSTDLAARIGGGNALCVELEGNTYGGAIWGIPLWNERGIVGALLLGEKLDGGLYTQEEMEIARASGERLVDLMAATEMARRLVRLERQRIAESQVVDARTRRVLHDDVLPQIHAAILALTGGADTRESVDAMTGLHRTISDLLRELPMPALPNLARFGILGTLRSLVAGELRDGFEHVEWQIAADAEERLARLQPLVSEVLFYAAREALRNAARYGRTEAGRASVVIGAGGEGFCEITIEDNGPGIDPARGSEGGSGQGLALHGTMMAVVGGSLTVESAPGRGTRVRLVVRDDAPAAGRE